MRRKVLSALKPCGFGGGQNSKLDSKVDSSRLSFGYLQSLQMFSQEGRENCSSFTENRYEMLPFDVLPTT